MRGRTVSGSGDGRNAKQFVNGRRPATDRAGIFSAPTALESYAQTFEEEGALDRLEAFASEFGPGFYGLPLNEGTAALRREAQDVPELMGDDNVHVVPFHAGETLTWRFAGRTNQTADDDLL